MGKRTYAITYYKVRGAFMFPIDMLRYDNSWPRHESESALIGIVDRGENDGPVTIELVTIGNPTPARWESFGWHVVQ